MVNDLRELLRDNASSPPQEGLDLGAVVAGGRRRVRRRRLGAIGGAALATAAIVTVTLAALDPGPPDFEAAGVPLPAAPTLRMTDAVRAVEGTHYRVLASHTNENLDRDNGQYFEGVTEDGLILFRDGPRMDQREPRWALLDPATGEKDWLPEPAVGDTQALPLELGADRLVLLDGEGDVELDLVVHVFDRAGRTWETRTWPDLPAVESPYGVVLGPDDRLYAPVPASQGRPPSGAGAITPGGDVGEADADGESYRLWSASMTDPSDVRDEGLTVGSVAFTDDAMVWTDGTNGDAGRVHVRDLDTGEDRSFDPGSGERCNLLSFGTIDERIVMGQYCGTYDDDVRDDRVQVLDTDGDQVVTLQGSGIEGEFDSDTGAGLVTVTSYEPGAAGTYVYDLDSGRFLRISEDVSSWVTTGTTQEGQFLWNTPENRNRGMTQHLGELLD